MIECYVIIIMFLLCSVNVLTFWREKRYTEISAKAYVSSM